MKKPTFLFLLIAGLGFFFVTSARAQFVYTTNNGTLTITGYTGPGGAVAIPSVINSYAVTAIGGSAFAYNQLTSVTIPTNVLTIGNDAFYDCSSMTNAGLSNGVVSIGDNAFAFCGMTKVIIPDSVTNMGNEAFYACFDLIQVTIGANVGNIGVETFYYCDALRGVAIPNSVTSIQTNAFYACFDLAKVVMGTGVTNIEDGAFAFSYALSGVTIPNSVGSIGNSAFYGCTNMTNLTLGNAVTSIGADAFTSTGVTSVAFPDSVTLIETNAFYDCDELTNVVIGAGVTNIEDGAFAFCNHLIGVDFEGNAPSLGSEVFEEDSSTGYYLPGTVGWASTFGGLSTVEVAVPFTYFEQNNAITITGYTGNTPNVSIPAGINGLPVTTIGTNAFASSYITNVSIPSSVTSIDDDAFYETYLTSVTIPNSVTNIGAGAFQLCFDLANAVLPGGISQIGQSTFEECYDLTNIAIPSGVTNIGGYAFAYTGLHSVAIPNGVVGIGDYGFASCDELTNVAIGSGLDSMGERVLSYDDLEAVTVDAQNQYFSSLGGVLFDKNQTTLLQYPTALGGSYVIPASVRNIGEYAFNGDNLINVTIPASVTNIGSYAFSSCVFNNLTIDAGGNLNEGAFSYCDSLTNLVISGGVFNIGAGAFEGCENLASVTIAGSVTNIAADAFSGDDELATALFLGNAPTADTTAFYEDTTLIYYLLGTEGWSYYFGGLFSVEPDPTASFEFTTNAGTITITGYPVSGVDLAIPNTLNGLPVTSIASDAFANSTLVDVGIPASVTNIGSGAFSSCAALVSVVFAGNPPTIGSSVFAGDTNVTIAYPPTAAGWGSSFGGFPAFPLLTWQSPTPITAGTPLTTTQLDAVANAPGTLNYTPLLGAYLNAGTNLLTAVFSPEVLSGNFSVTTAVNLVVLPAAPPTNSFFTLTPIYSFTQAIGISPSYLLLGTDGRLYGSLSGGGTNGDGAVFCLAANGLLQWSFSFNGTNGSEPGQLLQGNDGNLYGICSTGGTNNDGAVFSLTTNSSLRWSFSFSGYNGILLGTGPNSLLQGFDGSLYGSTQGGGTFSDGTIFGLTTGGKPKWSFSFNGTTEGYTPNPHLIQGQDGQLYGTTAYGEYDGATFSLNTNGQTNWYFPLSQNYINGSSPVFGLLQGKDGNLYGGAEGDENIFSLTTQGAVNWSIAISGTGYGPNDIIQGSNGNLYTLLEGSAIGCTTTNGTLLWNTPFPPSYGGGSVIQYSDQYILGESSYGSVFTVATNGMPIWNYSFSGPDGNYPVGNLVRANEGSVYGVTSEGGTANDGTLFRVTGSESLPFILTEPVGGNAVTGQAEVLAVEVAGSGTLSYQWQLDGTNISDDVMFSGSLSNTLTIADPALVDSGQYQLIITNAYGAITSAVAALTVYQAPPNQGFADALPLGGGLSLSYNFGGTNTIWWYWTAPNSGLACVLTQGSTLNPNVSVYSDNTLSNLTLMTNSLPFDGYDTSISSGSIGYLTFPTVSGTTYYIEVGGGYPIYPYTIALAVQPEGMAVSDLQTNLNYDGSTEFTANVEVANSGTTPQTMEVDVVAESGNSHTGDSYTVYPNIDLESYYFTNMAPGAITNFTITNTCPAPLVIDPENFGVGYVMFLNFTGTYQDSLYMFTGQWPEISGFNGPGGGVVKVAPSANSGGTYQLNYATINGPSSVPANSTDTYSGTVNLSNGSGSTNVDFSATEWTISSGSGCTISSNGVLSTVGVTRNTTVTITAYYIFNGTNSISTTVNIIAPPTPAVTVTSGANPSTYGNSVTFTVNLKTNGQGITGADGETVGFDRDGVQLGTGTLNSSGQAAYSATTAQLPAGTSSITAVYGGDANYGIASNSPALVQTVNQLPLTVAAGITANNKPYDATRTATLNFINPMLSGVIAGDTVLLDTNGYTASFATANVGSNIAVMVNGLTVTGASAPNYLLTQPTGLVASIISPAMRILINAQNVVISWPANATDFVLEETSSLIPPVKWSAVTTGITVNGTNNTVTINTRGADQYFILSAAP